MYELNLKHHFDAAHKLDLQYESPCNNIHGHRWEVEIKVKTSTINDSGMIQDFREIKEIINELDHCNLNDKLNINPTAENLAKYLYDKLIVEFNYEDQPAILEVTIWESPDASITYSV